VTNRAMPHHLDGYSIFDDKGEVKELVTRVVRQADPQVAVVRLRKIDFSYIFALAKKGKVREIELRRDEIDASSNWRSGGIDEALRNRIERAIDQL
jgi:hypothetical protein